MIIWLSSKPFIDFAVMFRYFTHCELHFFSILFKEQVHFYSLHIDIHFLNTLVVRMLSCLGIGAKNHLTLYVKVYFYAVQCFMSLYNSAHSFDYYTFNVYFAIKKCEISKFSMILSFHVNVLANMPILTVKLLEFQ